MAPLRRWVWLVSSAAGALAPSACGATTVLEWNDLGGGTSGAGNQGGQNRTPLGGFAATLPEAWVRCSDVSQCTLRARECCACPGRDLEGTVGVNEPSLQALTERVCPSIACMPKACDFTSTVAVQCREQRCVAVDIRQDELTTCRSAADCHLKWSTGCCEPCDSPASGVYPVAVGRGYEQAVCGQDSACNNCVPPPYPDNVVADCQNGQCIGVVLWLALDVQKTPPPAAATLKSRLT